MLSLQQKSNNLIHHLLPTAKTIKKIQNLTTINILIVGEQP
jgi:hypothetical protein